MPTMMQKAGCAQCGTARGCQKDPAACVKEARKATRCHSCEVLYINGKRCHEIGCPDAWKDATRLCKWCGQPFKPETKAQTCCDDDCAESYRL